MNEAQLRAALEERHALWLTRFIRWDNIYHAFVTGSSSVTVWSKFKVRTSQSEAHGRREYMSGVLTGIEQAMLLLNDVRRDEEHAGA